MTKDYFDMSGEATLDWLRQRWGKFTASEIHKLLTPARNGDMFGEVAKNYIKKIACEAYTTFDPTEQPPISYDMRMGKLREPLAFAHFAKITGTQNSLVHCGGAEPLFKHYKPIRHLHEQAGCSPDALLPKGSSMDEIELGAELKCPSPSVHMEYLLNISDQASFKKFCPEYFAQTQFSLMCFEVDTWFFASYNDAFPFKDKLLIVEIKKDQKYCDDLEGRLHSAVIQKNEILVKLQNRH